MASAVESTATVKSSAAMECAATESGITAESAAKSARSGTAETRPPVEAGPRSEAATIVAMEPRTRADKDPAGKIARAIVAIRGAGIRSEPIVAISANRSRTGEDRANPDRDLCVCSTRHNHEKPYQSHVF
jgi:hypothetical protein